MNPLLVGRNFRRCGRLILGLGVALYVLPIGGPLRAQDIRQTGPGVFVAGIPTEEFEELAAPEVEGKQRQTNWCWAASIQMILNYHGIPVTQEQVVARVFGADINVPGSPQQIMAALSGWALRKDGERVLITASPFAFQGSDFVQDLAFHWPLIVGMSSPNGGHALVLTAVTYGVGPYNQPMFISAILRDPWPGNDSRIEVPWAEFAPRVTFIARVRVVKPNGIPYR